MILRKIAIGLSAAILITAFCVLQAIPLKAEAPEEDNPSSVGVAESPGSAPAPITTRSGAPVPTINGELDFVMCGTGHLLRVYDEGIDGELFRAGEFDTVIPVQGFKGKLTRNKIVAGVSLHFMKVQFPPTARHKTQRGWVTLRAVRARSDCPGAPSVAPENAPQSEPAQVETPAPPTTPADPHRQAQPAIPTQAAPTGSINPSEAPVASGTITGLNSEACCRYPAKGRAQLSYLRGSAGGARYFGAERDGGRLHAACDLYRPEGEPVLAVAPGTVLLATSPFYEGTYEIEVLHPGGFVARYGEVLGKRAPGIVNGAKVQAGQVIGYVGKTYYSPPMLHFELYSGTSRGPLTVRGNEGYERRRDLINPTEHLRSWEKRLFGESW